MKEKNPTIYRQEKEKNRKKAQLESTKYESRNKPNISITTNANRLTTLNSNYKNAI